VLALIYAGYDYAAESWAFRPYGPDGPLGEISINSPAGVPVFPLKTILPVASFFLFLQGIAETIRCVQAIKTGAWPKKLHDVEKDVEEMETELIRKHEEEKARKREAEAKLATQQDAEGKEAEND
jgi:TRAP-type mannitol/chloroaromatic compound transport system permease small subunit